MRNYVDDIVKNTIGQIKYRESITLGEIKTDNGDGTYGVEISQSGKTYPNVPTAHYGDTFAVGEIAIITYEYGNKEMPRIWGHAKKIAQEPVEVEVDYSGSGGDPITTVTTLDAYSKTSNSAYLEGKIELSGGAGNCTRRGFKYGLTTAYGSDTHEDGDYGEGYFNKQITGLIANTTYHYKAYVLDADSDEQEGEDKIMTTSEGAEIFVVCDNGAGTYYIKSYKADGTLVDTWTIEATENIGNAICVDTNGNVYTITQDQHYIKKRNSNGVLTLTKTETHWVYGIAAGSDGYIYTFELKNDSSTNQISKRNASDLVIVSSKSTGNTNTCYGFAIDSDGYFYFVDSSTKTYEKWSWSGWVASYSAPNYNLTSLGIAGEKLGSVKWLNYAITIPLSLDQAETTSEIDTITSPGAVGSYGNYLLYTGYTADSKVALGKFNPDLSKVWTVVIPDSDPYSYGSIAAYPF